MTILALVLASCSLDSSTSVFDLSPGDCFDDPADGAADGSQVETLPMVDCESPHDNEVYAIFEVTDDLATGPYPGVVALDDEATGRCVPLFEDYVGSPYENTPRLDILWLSPTAESWGNGDRLVTCALFDSDASKLTGSQRASGA